DELLQKPLPAGANTTPDEVLYLKAHSLERASRTPEAIRFYSMIPDNGSSYYGEMATSRLKNINDGDAQQRASERTRNAQATTANVGVVEYPTPYRFQIVSESKKRGLDPR